MLYDVMCPYCGQVAYVSLVPIREGEIPRAREVLVNGEHPVMGDELVCQACGNPQGVPRKGVQV